MLQIKLGKVQKRSKLFIDSIRLAVSRNIDHIHLTRLKTLPNKSNVLITHTKKERSKKVYTLPQELSTSQRSKVSNLIPNQRSDNESRTTKNKSIFKPYENQYNGELSRSNSRQIEELTNNKNIQEDTLNRMIKLKEFKFLKKFQSIHEDNSSDLASQSPENSFRNQSINIQISLNRRRELKKQLFPSIHLPKLNEFHLSYKQILYGKSVELNSKQSQCLDSEQKEPLRKRGIEERILARNKDLKKRYFRSDIDKSRVISSIKNIKPGSLPRKQFRSIPVDIFQSQETVIQEGDFSPWVTKYSVINRKKHQKAQHKKV